MEEDPRTKKLARRIISEFSDFNLVGKGTLPQTEIERVTKIMLEEPDVLDTICYNEQATGIIRDTVLKGKISAEQLRRMTEEIMAVIPDSLFALYISALSQFSDRDFAGCTRTLCSRAEFARINDALDVLKVSCYNSGNYADACIFLSKSGAYDEVLFDGLKKARPDRSTVKEILVSLESFQSTPDLCKLYSFVSKFDKSDSILLSLAKCYVETGDIEEGKSSLRDIAYEESNDSNFLEQFIDLCFESQEYNHGYRAAKLASSSFPDKIEFEFKKATGLFNIGRKDEAIELLDQVISSHPNYNEARKYLADIYYEDSKYQDFLSTAEPLKVNMEDNPEWMLQYINAEINASDLDGAIRDLKKMESTFPENMDILRIKLDVQILINDTNGAFLTSRQIFENNRNDKKGRDYFFNELYERHEYEEFLKHLDEYGSDSEYRDLKLSSMIYVGNVDEAISYAKQNAEILSSDTVLDSVFFVVRDDSTILKLIEILKGDKQPFPSIVLRFIQGSKTVWKEELWSMAEKSTSLAIAWIIAKSTVNFRDRVKPEMISNLIARPRFNVINNLIDAVFLVYSGRVTEDMTDSRRFFYPITEALIATGDVDRAERMLQRAFNTKDPDAFYFFFTSQIELKRGDISSAERNIHKALEKLTNANFLSQLARVFIKNDNQQGIVETIDRIHDMGAEECICYDDLYGYVTEKKDSGLRNLFIERFEAMGVSNIWTERLERDQMAEDRKFEDAARVSRVIVVSRSKTPQDIRTHAEILKASEREKEREEFLESVESETEDPMIDIWLGDSCFLRKEYTNAISFYLKAVEKGEKPFDIRNYPDALIESGNYREAESLISELPRGRNIHLIKLYHRTGRISDIGRLIGNLTLETKEDEEVIKYISRILWINRQIRDTLVELFSQSHNYSLGNIIVERMLESRDFIGAEKVMRVMMKSYPEDLPNMRRLADLLHETKHPTEASAILLKAFRIVESKEEGSQILDTIMKIYFETGNYEEIKKLYSVNTDYVNGSNIQWIVRSFIETYDFDMADKIVGFYHGKTIPEDVFRELIDEMELKRDFLRLQEYAGKIFEVEFKLGRVLKSEEIVSIADIPLNIVEEVYHFIDSEEYYREEDEPRYELLTRDVFKKIARRTNIESIIYVKINVIYHSLPRKEVILAKNLYIYIKKCLRKRRSPMLNDKRTSALVKSALKMGLRLEPLDVAYNLNIGINEAMDIITLMEYVSNLNR